MEIGIDFVKDRQSKEKNTEVLKRVIKTAWENGLNLNSDNESNIQLMPPLTIDRKDLDKGLEILIDSVKRSI
ncbi:MAG: 4-aminobutyrate aminotransferase [Candidatus Daviesbacteria bacterium GW2011_GWA2_38_24]|uniref:4-aminobutyrate aminotransferase n=1 Tax=Candidatus Daviesbacteria bacterium GW2011_GWA2_38_24 TaxID=1618422 RepID=A0A0G0JVJ3_9BACT|nr:MAG: 4-aminobutyrate aminotransferase [Candidatus Daviesbacteria bacterium GW2011_GWA2_38_24]KKQ80947.1 MAG: 4-aminobutyrate aminotransferase [Candidatus Daviesbacteria bacterium GW2011_GWA1_38_7]OGE22865.1 MAG: hypothetical protein A2688_04505 [Candidatus Daviesbacteria bacterium RIFCSPHIGHO2_01_FULL_38_8]